MARTSFVANPAKIKVIGLGGGGSAPAGRAGRARGPRRARPRPRAAGRDHQIHGHLALVGQPLQNDQQADHGHVVVDVFHAVGVQRDERHDQHRRRAEQGAQRDVVQAFEISVRPLKGGPVPADH